MENGHNAKGGEKRPLSGKCFNMLEMFEKQIHGQNVKELNSFSEVLKC